MDREYTWNRGKFDIFHCASCNAITRNNVWAQNAYRSFRFCPYCGLEIRKSEKGDK